MHIHLWVAAVVLVTGLLAAPVWADYIDLQGMYDRAACPPGQAMVTCDNRNSCQQYDNNPASYTYLAGGWYRVVGQVKYCFHRGNLPPSTIYDGMAVAALAGLSLWFLGRIRLKYRNVHA